MKASGFKRWLGRLPGLTRPQRAQVLQALGPAVGLDRVAEVIEQARAAERCCPACASRHYHRHGHANGLQRYRFHGVASRYLPNYLGWRWALDGGRISSAEELLRAAIGLFHTQR